MTMKLIRALCAFVFAAAIAACSKEPSDAPITKAPEVARAVTVALVESRSIAGSATASGLLVPREEAAVGVEQAGYRVIQVFVEEGAIVKAGQALAELDDAVLRSRVAQAQAQAEKAQSEADRVKGLDGTGVLADEEIANRRSQARIAAAQLQELKTQSSRMTVRAPVSGIVLERSVRPGTVSGAEPMFRIARDGLIELDAEVPEAAILDIDEGSAVQVVLANGDALQGKVRLISPRIDPATKLGRVRVELPKDSALRAGGFARASFAQSAQTIAAVPEKAVQFEASGPLVTVIDQDNRAHRVNVRTGARSGGYVELVQGPAVGSRVALGGGAFLLDGDLVTPVNDAQGSSDERSMAPDTASKPAESAP